MKTNRLAGTTGVREQAANAKYGWHTIQQDERLQPGLGCYGDESGYQAHPQHYALICFVKMPGRTYTRHAVKTSPNLNRTTATMGFLLCAVTAVYARF